jgi:hypothetical protein
VSLRIDSETHQALKLYAAQHPGSNMGSIIRSLVNTHLAGVPDAPKAGFCQAECPVCHSPLSLASTGKLEVLSVPKSARSAFILPSPPISGTLRTSDIAKWLEGAWRILTSHDEDGVRALTSSIRAFIKLMSPIRAHPNLEQVSQGARPADQQ